MRVNIEIPEALHGKFSDVKVCYTDTESIERKVSLNIDFRPLNDFERNTTSIPFDFFLISSFVYGIDNLIDRHIYSVDRWAREIEVCFPVHSNNLSAWNNTGSLLEEALSFLTGDYWSVSFCSRNVTNIYKEKTRRWARHIPSYNKSQIQFISLFSGGLDSLIGIIDKLEELNDNSKILLASHFDPSSVGPNSDQTKLVEYLCRNYPNRIDWVQSRVSLSNYDTNGNAIIKETSYRSRSILFGGIGNYLLSTLPATNKLLIPENGTISLNYPLTPSRVSSLSTRTTHPYFLSKLQSLFNSIGMNSQLFNPYSNKTKGQMVSECGNRRVLQGIYEQSVSCGKRGRKTHWEVTSGTHHCGICMPCIYRRAALHKLGWDNQLYGNDLLNSINPEDYVDMPALFDYLKTSLQKEKIARNLIVTGSLPIDQANEYADVVVNSRIEIIKWIRDKGNTNLKTLLDIR